MAMVSSNLGFSPRPKLLQVSCRKREKNRDNYDPYKVIEITPPPKSLGVRCFPSNLHCGDSVTIEGQTYTISAVTHRYQLRKGKYEPSEKRLDVLSTARYILNLGSSGGFTTTVYPSGEPRRLTEAFRHPPGHYIVIYQR